MKAGPLVARAARPLRRRRDPGSDGADRARFFVFNEPLSGGDGFMNWDRIQGRWQQTKGTIREQWGKLTDDDLDIIAGKRDQLVGLLQRRYGATREDIERQVREFESHYADAR